MERIATLGSSGISTARGNYFAVLPDGRAVWTEVNGGRSRVMVVGAGKDPVPLVSTTEETSGPMTAVGAGSVAFMVGSKGRPAIGLATLANGRITRQFPFDKGFVGGLAASPDGNTIYAVAEGLVWAVPVGGEAPHKIRNGDGVTVDIATQSLVIFVQQPGNNRLIRIPLTGGPEREIPGSFRLGYSVDPGSIRNGPGVTLGGTLLVLASRDFQFSHGHLRAHPARLRARLPSHGVDARWQDHGGHRRLPRVDLEVHAGSQVATVGSLQAVA